MLCCFGNESKLEEPAVATTVSGRRNCGLALSLGEIQLYRLGKGVTALRSDVFSHSWPVNRCSLSHIWTSAMRPRSVSYLALKNTCVQKTREKRIKICQDCLGAGSDGARRKIHHQLEVMKQHVFLSFLNFTHLLICLLSGFWSTVITRQMIVAGHRGWPTRSYSFILFATCLWSF